MNTTAVYTKVFYVVNWTPDLHASCRRWQGQLFYSDKIPSSQPPILSISGRSQCSVQWFVASQKQLSKGCLLQWFCIIKKIVILKLFLVDSRHSSAKTYLSFLKTMEICLPLHSLQISLSTWKTSIQNCKAKASYYPICFQK